MKAMFANDHRFIPHGRKILTEAQFSAAGWDRYLKVFDDLLVVARVGNVPARMSPEELYVSSRERVSFRFVPNLSTIKAQFTCRHKALALVRAAVAECDAIVATVPTQTGLLAIQAAREQGKLYVVLVTGCAWDGLWNYGTWRGKLYAPVMTWRTRRAVANAPFAFYVTRRFLQGRYPCRTGLTVGCSDVEIPTPSEDVLEARIRRISACPDCLVFGLIGTLRTKFKGIQTVLEAIGNTRMRLPPVEFRVLGDGDPAPWRLLAERYGVSDIVRFEGTLPSGARVRHWLDEVDVYLQPSFKEGLPRALIEAMSRGCPAIASTCGGIPELLDPSCLIRPGDVGRLVKLLRELTTDQRWRTQQARRNWLKSFEYGGDVLQPRREAFWQQFAACAATRSDTCHRISTDYESFTF